jgi:thiamine-monophosphate kinase
MQFADAETVDPGKKSSDEPTRLGEVLVPIFSDESFGWQCQLANGSRAQLLAGVLEQDDCAIFELNGNQDIVLGSDYIRGSKFRLYEMGYIDNFDIGYYLAMANFSDIAAMGAQPLALLSVIRYPKSMPDDEFRSVLEGIKAACEQAGARNVGGDIGTAERLILSAAAFGTVEPGHALRRSGARPGDILCTTGYTGIAGAAQQYFYQVPERGQELDASSEASLLRAWRRPQALIAQGRLMSQSEAVTSCQDSSDGLKAAVETLAEASGVGFVLREDNLPVADVVQEVTRLRQLEALDIVFGDSVDFQLVFTVREQDLASLKASFESAGMPLFALGCATAIQDIVLHRKDGTVGHLPGRPWRHST